MTVDVLTYGETMGVFESDRVGPMRLGCSARLSIAGAESTVAIGVTRLGRSARWIGVVGADEVGDLVRRTLLAEAVDVSRVVVDPSRPTSLMLKERRSAQVSRVHYYRRGNAGSSLAPEHVTAEDISQARVVHMSGITPALSAPAREATFRALELAREAGVRTCVDLNMRSALWGADEASAVLTEMLKRADIVLATAEEATLLVDDPVTDPQAIASSLGRMGPSLVVIKRGEHGALAWDRGKVFTVGARPTSVVDPVGAGDAFAAGLLAGLLNGSSTEVALDLATAVASINVACMGDWEGLPTSTEIEMLSGADVLR